MSTADNVEMVETEKLSDAIPTRKLGNTGLEISALGFGTAAIGLSGYIDPKFDQKQSEKESLRAMDAAIEHGITFFDTAPAYANKIPTEGWSTDRASERMLGKVLKQQDRSKLIIATKNMFDRMEAKGIRDSIEASLKLLNIDYIDIFQVHGIIKKPFRADNWREFATDEVLRTFEDLKKEGKTKHIGISGYREGALCAAIESGCFEVVMPQFNFFYRGAEWELVKLAKEKGVGIIPMRPLTSGIMSKFMDQLSIKKYSNEAHKIAMEYLLQFDAVSSLAVGMRTVKEVEQNVNLIKNVKMS